MLSIDCKYCVRLTNSLLVVYGADGTPIVVIHHDSGFDRWWLDECNVYICAQHTDGQYLYILADDLIHSQPRIELKDAVSVKLHDWLPVALFTANAATLLLVYRKVSLATELTLIDVSEAMSHSLDNLHRVSLARFSVTAALAIFSTTVSTCRKVASMPSHLMTLFFGTIACILTGTSDGLLYCLEIDMEHRQLTSATLLRQLPSSIVCILPLVFDNCFRFAPDASDAFLVVCRKQLLMMWFDDVSAKMMERIVWCDCDIVDAVLVEGFLVAIQRSSNDSTQLIYLPLSDLYSSVESGVLPPVQQLNSDSIGWTSLQTTSTGLRIVATNGNGDFQVFESSDIGNDVSSSEASVQIDNITALTTQYKSLQATHKRLVRQSKRLDSCIDSIRAAQSELDKVRILSKQRTTDTVPPVFNVSTRCIICPSDTASISIAINSKTLLDFSSRNQDMEDGFGAIMSDAVVRVCFEVDESISYRSGQFTKKMIKIPLTTCVSPTIPWMTTLSLPFNGFPQTVTISLSYQMLVGGVGDGGMDPVVYVDLVLDVVELNVVDFMKPFGISLNNSLLPHGFVGNKEFQTFLSNVSLFRVIFFNHFRCVLIISCFVKQMPTKMEEFTKTIQVSISKQEQEDATDRIIYYLILNGLNIDGDDEEDEKRRKEWFHKLFKYGTNQIKFYLPPFDDASFCSIRILDGSVNVQQNIQCDLLIECKRYESMFLLESYFKKMSI